MVRPGLRKFTGPVLYIHGATIRKKQEIRVVFDKGLAFRASTAQREYSSGVSDWTTRIAGVVFGCAPLTSWSR